MIILGKSHSEENQGAKTPTGLSEWVVSGDVNQAIKDELCTRLRINKYVLRLGGTLKERIDTLNSLAKTSHYDCAIEVHCNALPQKDASGFSVIAWHKSEASILLAKFILDHIHQVRLFANKRGINKVSTNKRWIGSHKEYGDAPKLAFLEDTPNPAVIIEACYLTNPSEAEWISSSRNRAYLGWAIGRGIEQWLNERKEKLI